MPAPQAVAIPVREVMPHPRLAFRFRYDVDSLADSIMATADDSTPNGQLNPGRVVRREGGDGYYVYVGVRRFLALKLALGRTRDPRFGAFNAYVDEGLSELQMFVKAKAENEEEKGERAAPSLLEQVCGIRKIRDGIDPGRAPPAIRRLLALAEKMDDEKLKRLYDVERASHSRFTQLQLEGLAKIEGEEEFYTTAASAAAFRVREIPAAERSRAAAFHVDWFPRLFPEIDEDRAPDRPVPTEEEREEVGRDLEVHEDGVILAACPNCGTGNLMRLEGDISIVHLPPDPDGSLEEAAADSVSRARFACWSCDVEFCVFVKPEGGGYAVGTSLSEKFAEPREVVRALDLRYDRDRRLWEKLEGGDVVGTLRLARGTEKR